MISDILREITVDFSTLFTHTSNSWNPLNGKATYIHAELAITYYKKSTQNQTITVPYLYL